MSFDEQSTKTETRSLCARKEKRETEKIFDRKKNSLRLLLAESSFANDAQHDKRRSLQDWHPGCNWTIPQAASLATCFC
jgi:hypothetical protein